MLFKHVIILSLFNKIIIYYVPIYLENNLKSLIVIIVFQLCSKFKGFQAFFGFVVANKISCFVASSHIYSFSWQVCANIIVRFSILLYNLLPLCSLQCHNFRYILLLLHCCKTFRLSLESEHCSSLYSLKEFCADIAKPGLFVPSVLCCM